MRFKFSKMHGAGNDFVVLDGIGQNAARVKRCLAAPAPARRWLPAFVAACSIRSLRSKLAVDR